MSGFCQACGFDSASCQCSDRDCWCGEPSVAQFDHGRDYAFWTRQPQREPMCQECFDRATSRAENPPEPDGEAFRGGEAAAYQAELLEAARRLK